MGTAEDGSMLGRPLGEYARVRIWLEGLEKSWGADPESEQKEKLAVLERFCGFAGKDPDEIVAECLRPVDNGMEKIRYKARHAYIEQIEQFEASPGESRTTGNAVRSFFIHNGVAMGGRVLRG